MNFVRIELKVAPGLANGVQLPALQPGLQIVLGANASGKSTLARTLRMTLFSQQQPEETFGSVQLVGRQGPIAATIAGGRVHWQGERPASLPQDPERYALSLAELLRASQTDVALGQQIAIELAGGDDPQRAKALVGALAGLRRLRDNDLVDATKRIRRLENEADTLELDEGRITALRRDISAGEVAATHARLVEHIITLCMQVRDRDAAFAALAALPAGCELVHVGADVAQRERIDEVEAANRRVDDAQGDYDVAMRARDAALPAGVWASDPDLLESSARVEEARNAVDRAARLRDQSQQAARSLRVCEARAVAAAKGLWRADPAAAAAKAVADAVADATINATADAGVGAMPSHAREHAGANDATVRALEDALERRAAANLARVAAIDRGQMLQRQRPDLGGEAQGDPAHARRVLDALFDWRRQSARVDGIAAARIDVEPTQRPPTWLLGIAALLVMVGVVLMVAGASWPALGAALVAGAFAGLALAAWQTRHAAQSTGETGAAAAAHAASEALREATAQAHSLGAQPTGWTDDAVRAELGRWHARRAAWTLGVQIDAAIDASVAEADAAEAAADTANQAVAAALQALDMEAALADLSQRERAALVLTFRRAVIEAATAAAELGALRDSAAATDADAMRLLAGLDVGGQRADITSVDAAAATDAAAAVALGVATARLKLGRGCLQACAVAQQERASAKTALASAIRASAAGWRAVGVFPPPDAAASEAALAGLAHQVASLPETTTLRGAHEAAKRAVASLRANLTADVDALAVLGLDVVLDEAASYDHDAPARLPNLDALQLQLNTLLASAAEAATMHEELGRLSERLQAARGGHNLEDALAARHDALDALVAARNEAQTIALSHWLIDRARDEVEEDALPQTLAAARQWFGRFTRDAFGLEVASDGALSARNTASGARLALKELSDATRVQLLLALRLGSLAQGELPEEPLPICLDEVLSTSDPARFVAIAGALALMARGGRQILYFTSDPSEAAALRAAVSASGTEPPPIFTLGAAANVAVAALPAVIVDPAAPQPGESAVAWLARLHVPPLTLWQDVDAVHLAWLLDDAPDTLLGLASAGLDRVGPWRAALASGRPAAALPAGLAETVVARIAALDALLVGLRRGRAQPVAWSDVRGSGAITAAFEDKAHAEWTAHRGDGDAVLAAISGLPRFRTANQEALEAALRDVGVLASGERIDDAEAAALAVAAGAGSVVAGWVRRWLEAVGSAEPADLAS